MIITSNIRCLCCSPDSTTNSEITNSEFSTDQKLFLTKKQSKQTKLVKLILIGPEIEFKVSKLVVGSNTRFKQVIYKGRLVGSRNCDT